MRRLLRCKVLACAAILLAAGSGAAEETPQQTFDSLFGDKVKEVLATKAPGDDVALATELFLSATEAKQQPELLALMCRKAYDLAWKAPGGYRIAVKAMEYLAEEVPAKAEAARDALVDVHQHRYARTIGYYRRMAAEALMEALLDAASAKAKLGKHDDAVSLAGRAYRSIGKAIPEKKDELKAALTLFQDLAKSAAKIDLLERRLKADPNDLTTRDALIHMYLVAMDDPVKALGTMTAENAETLRTYVPLAARSLEDVPPAACLEMGDWYREFWRKAGPAGKQAMLVRAKTYYQRYLAGHKTRDATIIKATLALKQVNNELAKYGEVKKPKGTIRKMSKEILSFAKSRASLSGKLQLAVTLGKLREVNGGRNIHGTGLFTDGQLVGIDLHYDARYRYGRQANRNLANIDPLYGLALTSLNLAGCKGPSRDLAALAGMPLTSLNLTGCDNLRDMDVLHQLPLKVLCLPGAKALGGDLTFVRKMKLTSLTVTGGIKSLDGIQGMPLTSLTLSGCKDLSGDLSALKGLPLFRLAIYGCGINSLNGIGDLQLEYLSISRCYYLRNLRGLGGVPVKTLLVTSCVNLRDVSELKKCPALTTLNLSGNANLREISAVRGTKLTNLYLSNCQKLASLNGIGDLPLVRINLLRCISLRNKDYKLLARIPTLASLKTGDGKRDKEILERCRKLREKNR